MLGKPKISRARPDDIELINLANEDKYVGSFNKIGIIKNTSTGELRAAIDSDNWRVVLTRHNVEIITKAFKEVLADWKKIDSKEAFAVVVDPPTKTNNTVQK